MKIRVSITGTFLALALVLSSVALQNQKGDPEEAVKSSYIRKDLLQIPAAEEDLQTPLRNIFSPRRPGSPGMGREYGGVSPDNPGMETADEEPDAEEEDFSDVIDIRYIGYIRSQARTVALIFLDGEAMAIKAGEIVGEDVRILKISPTELEYAGPDSLTKSVSLEGEDR
jgi:hypothetical protein